MERVNISQLLKQMDPSSKLEEEVTNVLTEFIDDYLNEFLKKISELAAHRGSKQVR